MSTARKIGTATAGLSDTAKNVLVIGGVAVAGYVVYKVVDTINNVVDTVTDPFDKVNEEIEKQKELAAKLQKELASWENSDAFDKAFTPNPWVGKWQGIKAISNKDAIGFAITIHSAFGVINDDEAKIYGVYRQIPSKASMVKVATAYYSLYKKDLYSQLKSYLDPAELINLKKIINSKKDYTPL